MARLGMGDGIRVPAGKSTQSLSAIGGPKWEAALQRPVVHSGEACRAEAERGVWSAGTANDWMLSRPLYRALQRLTNAPTTPFRPPGTHTTPRSLSHTVP